MDIRLEIPARNLSGLQARVEDLSKRAARLGLPSLSLEAGKAFDKTIKFTTPSGRDREKVVPFVPVHLVGEPVTLSGWSFVATLHHEGAGETLVAVVPGEEIPSAYRWASNQCDHCGYSRRRNATYLIRHEDEPEVLKQVGRSCLRDFLPMADRDPENLARWAEHLGSFWASLEGIEDEDRSWSGAVAGEVTESLEQFLVVSAFIIRKEGWTSKSAASENERLVPTATLVQDYIWGDSKALTEWRREIGLPSDEDKKVAAAALEWAETALLRDDEGMSDYEHNLSVIVRLGYVRWRHMGLAASMIRAWERAMGVERKRQEREAEKKGKVETGRRVITGTVIKAEYRNTQWGSTPKLLLRCEDSEGGAYRLWGTMPRPLDEAVFAADTGGVPGFEWLAGRTVTFTATVKRSDKDADFGFWSRPSGGEIVE